MMADSVYLDKRDHTNQTDDADTEGRQLFKIKRILAQKKISQSTHAGREVRQTFYFLPASEQK